MGINGRVITFKKGEVVDFDEATAKVLLGQFGFLELSDEPETDRPALVDESVTPEQSMVEPTEDMPPAEPEEDKPKKGKK